MTNTKRLGRFGLANNTSDSPSCDSPSYFDQLASFYKDIGQRRFLSDWDKPLFSRHISSLEKVLAHARKMAEKSRRLIDRIESKKQSSISRARSIPENATIRQE